MATRYAIIGFYEAPFDVPLRHKKNWYFREKKQPSFINRFEHGYIRIQRIPFSNLVAVEKIHVSEWNLKDIVDEFDA